VPTAPDVRRLVDAYGVPTIGTLYTHDEIEGVIKESRTSSRYRTVTLAWRRQIEREHDIILGAEPGQGFVALRPEERIDYSGRKLKTGVRAVRRAGRVVSTTDTSKLTREQVERADHVRRVAGAVTAAARIEAGKHQPRLPEAKAD